MPAYPLNLKSQSSKSLPGAYGSGFPTHVLLEGTEKSPEWEKPHAETVAWSYDMEGHARKCVERYCELANKKTEQLHGVSGPCLDDHHFKKEELESVGELSKVCSQIVLECLYLARSIGLTFFGQWTNLLGQSLSGQEHVTNVWLV